MRAGDDPRAPLVSVVLPTNRPGLLAGALDMIQAQAYRPIEVLVVLHGFRRAALPEAARQALTRAAAKVHELPQSMALGTCLNVAGSAASGSIIAKFDDDDLYGPGYLEEAVGALLAGKGDIVGKSELYVYLARDRELLLWRGGASGREQDYVLGGTVVFRAELVRSPGFSGGTRTEVPVFLERCRAEGHRIYATSRRHFVLRRLDGEHRHTWHPEHDLFRREGLTIRKDIGPSATELLPLVS